MKKTILETIHAVLTSTGVLDYTYSCRGDFKGYFLNFQMKSETIVLISLLNESKEVEDSITVHIDDILSFKYPRDICEKFYMC